MGWAVTRPFRVEGRELVVNLAAPKGELAVEVLDTEDVPIPGFSRDEALVLRQVDELRAPVRWKNRQDLRGLMDRIVKLRFWLQQGSLYSFRIRGD